MTSIPPSLPASPAPATPQAGVTAAVVSATVPGDLSLLARNTVVEAKLLSSGGGMATVALSGAEGTVDLRLSLPVSTGAALLLQVVGQGSLPLLRVLSVNGRPAGASSTQAQAATQAQTGAGPTSAGSVTARVVPEPAIPVSTAATASSVAASPAGAGMGGGIIATLLRPASPPPATASSSPAAAPSVPGSPLPAGTTIAVRIVSLVPPQEPAPVSSQSSAAALSPTGNPVSGSPPAASSPAPSPLVPEAKASVPTTPQLQPSPSPATASVLASSVSGASPPPFLPGGTAVPPAASPAVTAGGNASSPSVLFSGVVAANTNAGQPLVQTSLGLFSLDVSMDIPPGTRVDLETVGSPTPPAAAPAGDDAAPDRPFPALAEALDVLRQGAPQLAGHLAAHLPKTGPSLAVDLFVFVNALANGRIWRWLGEATATALEEAGRDDLVPGLERELQAKPVPQPVNALDGWQGWMVPLVVDGRVERIRLMTRQRQGDRDEKSRRDEEGARFLLDLELSRTGAMQIDGLVKRQSKRFDLIVRTHRALPRQMRLDIRALFATSLEGLGMSGEAAFQETPRFVQPVPAAVRPNLTV